jgi:phosphatidate cytidylyltransferase
MIPPVLSPETFVHLCYVLAAFFAIGALGLAKANQKKSPEDKKEAWKKYWLYLFIVWPLLVQFQYGNPLTTFCIFATMALGGLVEIVFISWKKWRVLLPALLAYTPIASLFIYTLYFEFSVAYIFFSVVIFDGFSQLTGQLIGGPKILPTISPKKTLGGLVGGCLITVSTLVLLTGQDLTLGLVAITCIPPFVGDVLSSLLKRKAGVKDFNNLIPGHGGLMDRFDSFMFTVACWLLTVLLFS